LQKLTESYLEQERQQPLEDNEPEADMLPPEGADKIDETSPASTEELQPEGLEEEVMADPRQGQAHGPRPRHSGRVHKTTDLVGALFCRQ
jgi:hypothetical protein